MYYRRKKGRETQLWEGQKVTLIYATRMILFESIWKSFDALYACDYASKSLVLLWPEAGEDKPGEWGNPDHVRKLLLRSSLDQSTCYRGSVLNLERHDFERITFRKK